MMGRRERWLGILGLSVWLGIAQVAGCSDSAAGGDGETQVSSLRELGIDDGASEGAVAEALVAVDKETTLSLKTGAEVKIAAGSTTKELTVTLSRPPDKQALAFVQSTDKKLASAPYVITPHRQAFDKQVEVTLPVSGKVNTDKVQMIYLADEKDRDWKVVGKPQVSAGKAKIMVDHFSVLLLVEEEEPSGVDEETGGTVEVPSLDGGSTGDVCDGCPEGQVCGGDGLRECVPAPGTCERLSCVERSAECGEITNDCGGVLHCGECPEGQTCGAGGVPNVCGDRENMDACVPLTCVALDAECGEAFDGCGRMLNCGTCPEDLVCGILEPNKCDASACIPVSSADACEGKCGTVDDGCGGAYECGPANGGIECSPPTWCGGSGVPNECGGPAA